VSLVITRKENEIVKGIMPVKPEGKRKEGRLGMRWMVCRRMRGTWIWVNGNQRHKNGMHGESI
jgi:hypothetical protein